MTKLKHWLCLSMVLVMLAAMALPAYAADPLANRFAAFLIDAETMDTPTQNLHVAVYRRDKAGAFQVHDAVRYDCDVNRAAGDASFLIQPKSGPVRVEVDYLTDLDRDGVYELLDGEKSPVSDVMTPQGELIPQDGAAHYMDVGNTYVLSGDTLRTRAEQIIRTRGISGSGQKLPISAKDQPNAESVLFYITLHYHSSADQRDYASGYYVRLFDSVILPSDVQPGIWYYDAVKYALEHGFLSGTGADSFSPNGSVTRAQLAQILWTLGGSQPAEDPRLPDVAPTSWYFPAVSWCVQTGLMSTSGSGFSPNEALRREELTSVLREFALYSGLDVQAEQDLSGFTDWDKVSAWAVEGMKWAVSNGLISGSNGALNPGGSLRRSELAVVLRTFHQNVLAP